MLENYLRDFNALAEWFRLKWDYEKTPLPQRPTSLTWDISKTNLTKTSSRSGKSSPSLGSGQTSPSISGKVSPRILPKRMPSSAPTSPLPYTESVILEEKIDMLMKSGTKNDIINTKQSSSKNDSNKQPIIANKNETNEPVLVGKTDNLTVKFFDKNDITNLKLVDSSIIKVINKISSNSDLTNDKVLEAVHISNVTEGILQVKNGVKPDIVDSPSEDQKTYDMFRKIGVGSAEKSTSTNDDFPKLPIKKTSTVKINQECQTDDMEKKTVLKTAKTDVTRPLKISIPTKPAYATALTRSTSAKVVSTNSKPKTEVVKPTVSTLAKVVQKPVKPFSLPGKSITPSVTTTTPARNSLARSKTVGDIKSNITTRPNFKTNVKEERKPVKVASKVVSKSNCTPIRSKLSASNLKLNRPEGGSSLETLVKSKENSANSIASSVETLTNENIKNSLHSDGWLTVKGRKSRRSDSGLWVNRFNQVSATASLPALALLPDTATTEKSTAKSNIANSNKKSENNNALVKKEVPVPKLYMRRSHTTLSRMSVSSARSAVVEKNLTNLNSGSKSDREKYSGLKSKIIDVDSETDDEGKLRDTQEDLASEEEHRKKAKQLTEEEERLTKEIAHLQGLEIDVDTETDGTETDGELQGDNDFENEDPLHDNDEGMSLEARYEPMLAGENNNNIRRKSVFVHLPLCLFHTNINKILDIFLYC